MAYTVAVQPVVSAVSPSTGSLIGGTLLSGGVGYVAGTLFGVLTLGVIQTLIMFDGSLSSWWTRIVIGALLFVFCVLQRVFEAGRKPGS